MTETHSMRDSELERREFDLLVEIALAAQDFVDAWDENDSDRGLPLLARIESLLTDWHVCRERKRD